MENILFLTNQIKQQEEENKILTDNLTEKELKIANLSDKLKIQKDEIDTISDKIIAASEQTNGIKIENLFKDRWTTLNMLCNEYFEKGASEKTRLSIIKDIEEEIKSLSSPKRLKQIEDNVNKYMGNIVLNLKQECPFLKSDDITFITLIYAGFSPRAISLITNIKLKYYYNKKERLIKKIQYSSSPNKQAFIDKLG